MDEHKLIVKEIKRYFKKEREGLTKNKLKEITKIDLVPLGKRLRTLRKHKEIQTKVETREFIYSNGVRVMREVECYYPEKTFHEN